MALVTVRVVAVMRFGLLGSPSPSADLPSAVAGQELRDWLDFSVEAERLGFVSTFLVEHHFTGWGQVSSPLTLLAALAVRTTTLRLGSGVLALPWHNPVLLAEQAATVDALSGGRLDLGIGRGYRHAEFAGFGIAPHEAEERFAEAVAVMTRAWTSRDRFSHAGAHWRFEDIVVEPAPVQSPHPPLWMAAGSDASVTRAAAAGYRLILDQYAAPCELGDRIGAYRNALAARPFEACDVAVARHLHIADAEDELAAARQRLVAGTERILRASRDPKAPSRGSHVLAHQQPGAAGAHALYGTPDQVVAGLRRLRDAGVAYVLLIVENDRAQLRRFHDEVMPCLAD